jgi:hypothetical protein
MRFKLALILLIGFAYFAKAQRITDSCITAPYVSVNFSGYLPFGDMNKRFGSCFAAGGTIGYKTKKNWLFSGEFNYLFSRNVKEDVLTQLRNDKGNVTNNNGFPADIRVYQRGWVSVLDAGKLFTTNKRKPNTGVLISAGAGVMYHKIKLYDAEQKIAAIKGDLQKGYDRLSIGPCLHQSIGFFYLSNNRLVNIHAAFECYQGFTKNVRGFNYDGTPIESKQRIDIILGMKLAWVLPLYKRTQDNDFYYY